MIKHDTTEPHHSHQNPVANWCALYMCQVNNHVARKLLGWKTPIEISTGNTPDISQFRFHFYEPLWYFDPSMKTPKSNLLKATILAHEFRRTPKNITVLILHRFLRQITKLQNDFKLLYPRSTIPSDSIPTN